jgi:regulator of nucleoside diphosphate kinase
MNGVKMAVNRMVVNQKDKVRLSKLLESICRGSHERTYLNTLREQLDGSRASTPARVPQSVVTMRSRVCVRDINTDEVDTFTLVYPDEVDLDQGKLSVFSPLGSALFGARVGEVVNWRLPRSVLTVRIEEILYQPESAGDHDL